MLSIIYLITKCTIYVGKAEKNACFFLFFASFQDKLLSFKAAQLSVFKISLLSSIFKHLGFKHVMSYNNYSYFGA